MVLKSDEPTKRPPVFSHAGMVVIYFGMLVVSLAGLRAASTIILPFLLALFVSIVCWPLLNVLQRRLPFAIALTMVMTLLMGITLAGPILIGGSVHQVVRSLPEFQERLLAFERPIVEKLEAWDIGIPSDELLQDFDVGWMTAQFGRFFNALITLTGNAVIILVMIGFMLTEASWFSMKLASINNGSQIGAQRLDEIVNNTRRYLTIKTIVSLATGVVVWLGLLVLGVEHAAMWGFIAFLLNYIPTFGSIIAGVFPVLFSLVQNGPFVAMWVAGLYVAVNQVFGSIIEPRLQGRGLGLSPLIVFVSLIFWGWMFGPIGMLLSAPLTMVVRIACEAFPETRWVCIVLGGRPTSDLRS